MKRIVSIFMVALMLLMTVSVSATDNSETSLSTSDRNVLFTNDYVGFCLDVKLKGANYGDTFTPSNDTSVATNNTTNVDVSQKLKVLFTQCFEDIFVSDGNGSYKITDTNTVQAIVWHYTDGQHIWGNMKTLSDRVDAYTGDPIPDDGYSITLDNGDVVTFSFLVMQPANEEQQDFFAYKLAVSNEPPHEHDHSEQWSSDENNHWHECECGDKADVTEHDYDNDCDPDCNTCGEDRDIEHDYSEQWSSDETNHWHECECGDKADEGSHNGTEADCVTPSVCEDCGKELEGVDPENHTGNTVVKDRVEATEDEPGYTGDIYCEDCDALLEEGEPIPAGHEHVYSDEWTVDGENHWHECECGHKDGEESHSGGEANCGEPADCEICNQPYGETDGDNHVGDTEIRGYREATKDRPGYTGDTYCKTCDALLAEGEEIPYEHSHVYSDEWTSDESNHWHECECGDKADEDAHDYDNDCDTDCNTCGEDRETSHSFGNEWVTDGVSHWHECKCGLKANVSAHSYKNGHCTVCDTVDEEYESPLPDTGDNMMLYVWIALALIGICGCVIVAKRTRNRA